MPIVESEYFVMQKVVEVTIERISAPKSNQNLIPRVDGDRGFTKELVFRMYT